MRLLVTADLHYNNHRSRPLADELIDTMNAAGGDVLLVVGDTASGSGDALENCLSRFSFSGPKLFVAGNHELWTNDSDSYALFTEELPRRVRDLGWRWLQTDPLVCGSVAFVGSIGWYDYSLAQADLGIPRRFYEHKIAPGTAAHFTEFASLLDRTDDISPLAMQTVARWNDGRYVKLGRSDEAFTEELAAQLRKQLSALRDMKQVVAAIHHLPFRQMLPPPHNAQWDFAKAYLGSQRLGDVLLEFPNVTHLLCGHSHLPMETQIGPIRAINIGSGYRWKTYRVVELP